MKQKIYIDSTIPSFHFDGRDSIAAFAQITRQWWAEESCNYDIWISVAVVDELSVGDYPGKDEIIDFIKDVPLLEEHPDLEDIANFYIDNYVMPKNLRGDAIHLAYASYYSMDYLLTWNCNHLANANKRKHMRIINGRLGLITPELVTPLELFSEEKTDDY